MRLARGLRAFAILLASVSFAACGGGSGGGDDTSGDDAPGVDAADPPPPAVGFQIVTPDITIAAGDERTYCYYATVDTDTALGIKRWSSSMTPGSHHLIVYFTDTAQQPDGTITEDCGVTGSGINFPVWTYSAQTPENEMAMPAGVGMTVAPQQHLFIQMHYLNATNAPIDAHVTLNGDAYEAGVTYQPAAAYVTFNTQIDIPAGQTGSAQGTCAVPDGATFFTLATHSHRFSTRTEVFDGASMVFESEDWEHPIPNDWFAAPHYQFSGDLTYRCEYDNTSGARVQTGDSAETDEMCMAVGYFFPSSEPVFCIDSFVLP